MTYCIKIISVLKKFHLKYKPKIVLMAVFLSSKNPRTSLYIASICLTMLQLCTQIPLLKRTLKRTSSCCTSPLRSLDILSASHCPCMGSSRASIAHLPIDCIAKAMHFHHLLWPLVNIHFAFV